MYYLNGYKDGLNYTLEIKNPYGTKIHTFPTKNGLIEYLKDFKWHLSIAQMPYKEMLDI